MRLIRAIRHELALTWSSNAFALIACFLLPIALEATFLIRAVPELDATRNLDHLRGSDSFTAGDIIVFINKGMPPFDPITRKVFTLDMIWAAPYFLFGYLACSAFSKEAGAQACQIVTRIRSRGVWIVSRCARATILVMCYLMWELLLAMALGAVFGASPSLQPSEWSSVISDISVRDPSFAALTLSCLSVPATAVAAALAVTAFSAALGPRIAFLLLIALVVTSAYIAEPLLFLGSSMELRGIVATGEWPAALRGIGVCFAVIAASLLCAPLMARKADFL
ncbi:hypothetical protein Corgl_0381 [Coriobacterium glomerans PW2]|uniref:ABC-2 family transporter protein n=1 Tax=Coriobacterium glomerans (strain ATCC 49209 / DSM 20642 / JCM 10262 / PW2) TaxID=700015 RepID=F2NAH3_CORGP|nr:hypothetical protein [Coriobacterium glomerans]AEB06500.1 hypothetical protein Corgl_0381 [Coriobacterium glomerans PW2]